ncbi:Ligand of Numb protein X 2 [Labeo rohita]|uniref:Ligand of Numb protein X 2 n=1 Tax=Labeo rohita TaxID=84645 RepID=A0ABQ8M3R1_LABRO|nr:Ligand of Numb protein X 2 [Labeo rohita]
MTSPPAGGVTWARVCKECGQCHDGRDSHLFEYQDEVDDELVCHICLQPLLQPMDTPCGHTYCFHCLSNFLHDQDFCPVDRQRLQLQNCRSSSLLVRNLLDKLVVLCPFRGECQQSMQRCELQPHLHNRCPAFKRLREEAERKKRPSWNELKGSKSDGDLADAKSTPITRTGQLSGPSEPGLINPAYEEGEDDTPLRSSLVAEATVVELFREDPDEDLGLRIVGGKDTPLGNIVIQEIVRDSLAAQDGKLAPGDHILEVNDVSLASIPHSRAIAVLRQSCSRVRLTVMQEKGFKPRPEPLAQPSASPPSQSPNPNQNHSTVIQVTLVKRDRSEPLGIKLIRKSEEPGVFILDLLPGGLAAKDGKLKNNDKASEMRVNFVVMRLPDLSEEGGEGQSRGARRVPEPQYFIRRSEYMKVVLPAHVCARGDFSPRDQSHPAFVTLPHQLKAEAANTGWVVGDESRCPPLSLGLVPDQKAGVLLSELLQPLELMLGGRATLLGRKRPPLPLWRSGDSSKTGRRWLKESVLPQSMSYDGSASEPLIQEKTVSLKKEPRHSLGITIAGGRDCRSRLPVYITSVQPVGCLHRDGTVKTGDVLLSINDIDLTHLTYNEAVTILKSQAAQDKVTLRVIQTFAEEEEQDGESSTREDMDTLEGPKEDDINWAPLWTRWLGLPRCGDEIVAVNGVTTVGMNNSSLIPMLKLQKNKVTLTVVSWPGSLV